MNRFASIAATATVAIGFIFALTAIAQPGGPPRELPAAAQPPADAVEAENEAKRRIPPPPPKGKAKGAGRVLKASPKPPPDVAAEQQAGRPEQVPAPPGRTRVEALADKVRARPGGRERVDAAKERIPPGKLKRPSAGLSLERAIDGIIGLIVPAAHAGETFTLDLTPQVNTSTGAHAGLRSSTPYGIAYFYGARVYYYRPRNDSIYMSASAYSALGHQVTNPYVSLTVNIPTDGWYIANINSYAFTTATVDILHYENGPVLLEQLPRASGWADYPTLQYLSAGYHYFYWVLPGGGYVSGVSVDSYP